MTQLSITKRVSQYFRVVIRLQGIGEERGIDHQCWNSVFLLASVFKCYEECLRFLKCGNCGWESSLVRPCIIVAQFAAPLDASLAQSLLLLAQLFGTKTRSKIFNKWSLGDFKHVKSMWLISERPNHYYMGPLSSEVLFFIRSYITSFLPPLLSCDMILQVSLYLGLVLC